MANIMSIWKRMEIRRQQQAEAAERRRKEEAARGLRDQERLKRMQLREELMEWREQELQNNAGATLRWTAD